MRAEYLCIVIDRSTNEELADYVVEANQVYYARHSARRQFVEDYPKEASELDYYVDSMLME